MKIKAELVSKVKSIVQSRSLQFRLQRIKAPHRGSGTRQRPKGRGGSGCTIRVRPPARDHRAGKICARSSSGSRPAGHLPSCRRSRKLPKDFPLGIAIVQHMPPRFTKSMAERLDGLSQLHVKEAEEGDRLEPGMVLIAPGGQHMVVQESGQRCRCPDHPRTG